MFKINNTLITYEQLVKLGVEIIDKNITSLLNESMIPDRDLLKVSNIVVRPDYWLYWLIETYENLIYITELDWLLAMTHFIKYKKDDPLEEPIKNILNLFNQTDIKSNFIEKK